MKKHIILYLILFSAGNLFCQGIRVDTGATFVIANGGLNLRSAPNVGAKKLATIPFGATVKYISDQSFNVDSIAVRHTRHMECENKEVVKGLWVKVAYKKMEGYVLDLYLSRSPRGLGIFNEKYSGDFVLLYPGCGCNIESFHNPAGWEWFGYFEEVPGKYRIEKINISYYRTRIYTCDLIVSASKNDKLSFIIGSKNGKLSKDAVVRGKSLLLHVYDINKPIKKSDLESVSVELIKPEQTKEWRPDELYLKRGKKRQLLNKPEYSSPYEIKFMGDLDGDLKDDYIIHYGDTGGISILYLTTKAKPTDLIQPVAMTFASYCC